MFAPFAHHSPATQCWQQVQHRLSNYGDAVRTLVTAPRDDQYFLGAAHLTLAEPRFGPVSRVSSTRQRITQVQAVFWPEFRFVECFPDGVKACFAGSHSEVRDRRVFPAARRAR